LIHRIQDLVRKDQSVFRHTGGLHASAILDLSGTTELIREDIGRHNALDKLIGARAAAGKDTSKSILFVSGRAGFELVQKAVVAGIPIMVAVGAPSSLAVALAQSYDQTLIGFARDEKFNVYSGLSRVEI
jgi:FdhD protein